MANTDTRVEDLLNSLIGCDFLVTLVETGISPESLADPKVSLRLAASAADSVDRFNADHDLIAAALPALIQCFVDALQRFGVVELSGIQVTAKFLEPDAQPYAGALDSGRSYFNTTLKGRTDALIALDEELLGEHTEAELLANLSRKHTGAFEFGPVVTVPEQPSIKAGDEFAISCISPASSGLGISVMLPEWMPSAVGWVLAVIVDEARTINPNANSFTIRVTRSSDRSYALE